MSKSHPTLTLDPQKKKVALLSNYRQITQAITKSHDVGHDDSRTDKLRKLTAPLSVSQKKHNMFSRPPNWPPSQMLST